MSNNNDNPNLHASWTAAQVLKEVQVVHFNGRVIIRAGDTTIVDTCLSDTDGNFVAKLSPTTASVKDVTDDDIPSSKIAPLVEVNCSRPCKEGETDIMYQNKSNEYWYRAIITHKRGAHSWMLPVIVAQSAGYPTWERLVEDFPQFQRKNPAEYSKPEVDFDKGLKVGGADIAGSGGGGRAIVDIRITGGGMLMFTRFDGSHSALPLPTGGGQ